VIYEDILRSREHKLEPRIHCSSAIAEHCLPFVSRVYTESVCTNEFALCWVQKVLMHGIPRMDPPLPLPSDVSVVSVLWRRDEACVQISLAPRPVWIQAAACLLNTQTNLSTNCTRQAIHTPITGGFLLSRRPSVSIEERRMPSYWQRGVQENLWKRIVLTSVYIIAINWLYFDLHIMWWCDDLSNNLLLITPHYVIITCILLRLHYETLTEPISWSQGTTGPSCWTVSRRRHVSHNKQTLAVSPWGGWDVLLSVSEQTRVFLSLQLGCL
jgi:hypothetical protein